jgi:undecaprenyl-diphosphatase
LGTLIAVVAVFWQDLRDLSKAWWQGLRQRRPLGTASSRLAWWIALGTIPAVLTGLLLETFFEALFDSPRAVGIILFVTAALLVLSELFGRRQRGLEASTWIDGLWIGLGQAVAIAPGLSRSGATIASGILRGFTREAAARFSFLLSVPIIAGTGLLQLVRLFGEGGGKSYLPALAIGFVAAAASGYGAIRFLLAYVRRRALYPFAFYCIALGIVVLIVL